MDLNEALRIIIDHLKHTFNMSFNRTAIALVRNLRDYLIGTSTAGLIKQVFCQQFVLPGPYSGRPG